jgi:hypothetical protein
VVWICPRCGARLVSRNLWHSCGQYTLETQVRFAGLAPRRGGFQASFALHRWLDSPRIVKRVDYGRDGAGTTSASRPAPIWMMSCAVGSRKPTMSSGCRLAWETEPAAGHAPARALEATSAARPGAEHAAEVSSADLVALPTAMRSTAPTRPAGRTRAIGLTCNEVQHLFAALVAVPVADTGHRWRWSLWR